MSIKMSATLVTKSDFEVIETRNFQVGELADYGYDGAHGYDRAFTVQERAIMVKAKRLFGMTGRRGQKEHTGYTIYFFPYRSSQALVIECLG